MCLGVFVCLRALVLTVHRGVQTISARFISRLQRLGLAFPDVEGGNIFKFVEKGLISPRQLTYDIHRFYTDIICLTERTLSKSNNSVTWDTERNTKH